METTAGIRQVLDALKAQGPKTARELSKLLGVGPVVVRAHLRNLIARGLVEHQTTRQPVGRPARRFRLAKPAACMFPQQYERFATQLVEEMGGEALERVLVRWEDALEGHIGAQLPEDPARRLEALATHQSRYGFMASVHGDVLGQALIECHCPIASLASKHPEICRHEAALFQRLLGRPVTLAACQALGSETCIFRIAKAATDQERTPHVTTTQPH